ncbi:hypothetical protein C0Q70_15848 [Pomacea canaliculata]|uniref:Cadherin domain-containing protein n=1 Tax=Pomacea canaliculata TaxID=400727 RepID=A0A2T7NVY7_POMCA|nr:hypothetical protein C0Q70_15848 [Pomacea canaliculata]
MVMSQTMRETETGQRVQKQLDRERTSRYFLVLAVADNGSPALTATTTITFSVSDVNDNSPVWSSTAYTFSVTENQPAGSPVGQVNNSSLHFPWSRGSDGDRRGSGVGGRAGVTATDADIGVNAALTYTLTLFWTGSSANFALDPATGRITTALPLDREATAQYSALMRVVDGGSPQLNALANVTISIGDLNDNVPTFDSVSYAATTTENDPVGTGILTLVVTDKDIGSNANISLFIDTSTTAGARAAQFLQVTSGTGVVSVKSTINRETNSSFTFTVVATDAGSPALTSSANVTITVTDQNDNVPVFTQTYYNTEIAYTGQCNRSIVAVSAKDADSGANGQVAYYLVQSSYDYVFQVDSATGLLSQRTTAGAGGMYTMQVTARDGGSPTRSATTPASIRIDAMVPNNVVITFNLGITATAFQGSQDEFVAQCQALVRQTYPTAVARLWCSETGSNSLAKVHVYFLRDNTTDSVANVNAAKYYVDSSTALSFFTSDPNGSPSSALSGTQWAPYNVKTVQLYYESQTPWQQSGEGIAVVTTCCVLGAVLLGVSAYMGVTYCRQSVTSRPRARKISVEGRSKVMSDGRRHEDRGDPDPPFLLPTCGLRLTGVRCMVCTPLQSVQQTSKANPVVTARVYRCPHQSPLNHEP